MRLFFAVWPPPQTSAALAQWAVEAAARTGGRALAEASIHLTLAFLGDVGEDRLAAALRAARRTRGSSHDLPIEQAKRWGNHDLVWVGPQRTPPELVSLAQALGSELQSEGFAIESRPFVAHVTLVRKARRAALPPLTRVQWPVTEFTLVHSMLSRHGSSYSVLERFPMA